MAGFPPINAPPPRAPDLVDAPVLICGAGPGFGTGFGATFRGRVGEATGAELGSVTITAGGMGIWGNSHVELPTGGPAPPRGTVEVFEFSAENGSEINKVVVPVVFGRALIDP